MAKLSLPAAESAFIRGPMEPIAAVPADELPPVPARIGAVQLIVLGRDEHCYTWETTAAVPLGGAPA